MLISNCGEVVCDEERMTNLLQQQFSSVFSDPSAPEIKTPEFEQPEITYNMTEDMFTITRGDIVSAISNIKNDSAAGPDELPAILLKRCAESMSEPIQLLWQESFRKGVVPDFYKKSHIIIIVIMDGIDKYLAGLTTTA